MTRNEYRKLLLASVSHEDRPYYAEFVNRKVNFVHVLQDVALDEFCHPGKYPAELVNETRRRLLQLHQTGVTDE